MLIVLYTHNKYLLLSEPLNQKCGVEHKSIRDMYSYYPDNPSKHEQNHFDVNLIWECKRRRSKRSGQTTLVSTRASRIKDAEAVSVITCCYDYLEDGLVSGACASCVRADGAVAAAAFFLRSSRLAAIAASYCRSPCARIQLFNVFSPCQYESATVAMHAVATLKRQLMRRKSCE